MIQKAGGGLCYTCGGKGEESDRGGTGGAIAEQQKHMIANQSTSPLEDSGGIQDSIVVGKQVVQSCRAGCTAGQAASKHHG